MNRSPRLVVLVLALLVLLAPALTAAHPDQPEILWDTWGGPHIYAPDNAGLFYAFGWASMEAHGDLLLKLFGQARGRAAEYWGADYLDGDILAQTVDIPGQAAAAYAAQTDEFRGYLDAFAAGMNACAAAHPGRIGDDWRVVLPVSATDVLASGIRSLRYEFIARQALGIAARWQNGAYDGAGPHSGLSPAFDYGSNGWAIGPSRSASGNAMLLANPHQPWSDSGLFFEAQLVSPDVNIYGAALMGSPVLNIGFNAHLGWTHTVNTHDGWDLYTLTPMPDGGYLFDGQSRPYETRDVILKVRAEDGSLVDHPLTVRRSVHGPVVAARDDGTALALRVVGDAAYSPAGEWWDMARATTLQEFEAALARLQIPMFSVIYAGRDGNILHVFNGLVPVHDQGDWAFWNHTTGLHPDNPAFIPGDSSEYLWTAYHPYSDLPRVLNPSSGWLQNSNEPPWTTTFPLALNPADYPPYMAPPPYVLPRTQSSLRLLMSDESITFDELVAYKHSTHAELTDHLLDDLIAAARELGNPLAGRAAGVLEAWDRQANADSVGAVLFALWIGAYYREFGADVFAVPWDIDDPLNTPHGLVDREAAVRALEMCAVQLEALRLLGGGIDVPYGAIFRLRYGAVDLPANGGPDLLGTFRVLTFVQDSDLRFRPVHGDSFIAVVEFSDPVRAQVLLGYGNATQPGSPHIGDQLELFARKRLRTAWLTRAEVEAHLELRESLTPGP